jgi:acyl carrier protein
MTDKEMRLRQCFEAVFPTLTPVEIARANSSSVATWDSLATINLITVIEEEFRIQIAPQDIDQMISFDLILDYLRLNNNAT